MISNNIKQCRIGWCDIERPFSCYLFFVFLHIIFFQLFISCLPNAKPDNEDRLPHELSQVLKAHLQVELNNDPERVGIGQFLELDMNTKGELFLTEGANKTIHRLTQEGKIDSLYQWRSGRGPGEFMSMTLMIDESQEVAGLYDPAQQRITILDVDLEQIKKTVQVKPPPGIGLDLIGFTKEGLLYEGFKSLTLFNAEEQRELLIYFQEFGKEEPELIFTLPPNDWLFAVNKNKRSTSLLYKPLGRRVSLTKFEDHLIYISNDGFGFSVYSVNGDFVYTDSLEYNFRPYSFNEKQIEEHIMSQVYPHFSEQIKKDILNAQQNALDPEEKVYFQKSFVDVQGRLWFELYPELFEGETRWIMWDTTSDEVVQVVFDEEDVRPQNAIDNTVVAFKKNKFDLETVRIYSLEVSDP